MRYINLFRKIILALPLFIFISQQTLALTIHNCSDYTINYSRVMLESPDNRRIGLEYAGSITNATRKEMIEGWLTIKPHESVNLPNTFILMKFERNGKTSIVKPQNREDVVLDEYCVMNSPFEIVRDKPGTTYLMNEPESNKTGSCEELGGELETFYYLKGYSVYYLGCPRK